MVDWQDYPQLLSCWTRGKCVRSRQQTTKCLVFVGPSPMAMSMQFSNAVHSGHRYEVDIYEGRQWIGGKVASYKDKDGNDIEVSEVLMLP